MIWDTHNTSKLEMRHIKKPSEKTIWTNIMNKSTFVKQQNNIGWNYDLGDYKDLIDAIVETIPQFFGPIEQDNSLNERDNKYRKHLFTLYDNVTNEKFTIFGTLSKDVQPIIAFIKKNFGKWCELIRTKEELLGKRVQVDILNEWLSISTKNEGIAWATIVQAIDELCVHNNENNGKTFNIVVKKADTSNISLHDFLKKYKKLTLSDSVYFSINTNMNIIEFNMIEGSYKHQNNRSLLAEKLESFIQITRKQDVYFSIHVLDNGDIVIANKKGIVAAKRDNQWRIYILKALKDFYKERFVTLYDKKYSIFGQQILHIAMKLSYRRKGAILIFDSKESTVFGKTYSKNFNQERQKILDELLGNLFVKTKTGSVKINKEDVFMDIASQDGAMICSETKMIASNTFLIGDDNGTIEVQGARELAANIAFRSNEEKTIIIKISEDGKMKVFFTYLDMPIYMNLM